MGVGVVLLKWGEERSGETIPDSSRLQQQAPGYMAKVNRSFSFEPNAHPFVQESFVKIPTSNSGFTTQCRFIGVCVNNSGFLCAVCVWGLENSEYEKCLCSRQL